MASYKEPSFAERTALARQAREKALAGLKAKPAPDPALIAERQAALAVKQAAEEARRAARREEMAQAKAAKAAQKAAALLAAEEAAAAKRKPELSEAEKKALRDARYAARKGRK